MRHGKDLDDFIKIKLDEWFSSRWEYLDNEIPDHYRTVNKVFSSPEAIKNATMEEIFEGLDQCHAFHDRLRFYDGGHETMRKEFFKNDLDNLKKTFTFLIFGGGNYIERMGACIFDNNYFIPYFGKSSVQELYGWVNEENIPICNSRTMKSLRYLGFNVRTF